MSTPADNGGTVLTPALGDLPTSVAGREVTAGDYVVGLLDSRTAQRVRAAMQVDPAWRDSVAAWEARFAPIALLARPEPVAGNLWDRIEARISPPDAPKIRNKQRAKQIWRAVAVLAVVTMAGGVGYFFYPRGQAQRLVAVLANDRNLPGVLVERDPKGNLSFINLPAASGRQLQAPSGKVLQLWAIAQGAQAPTNLGVLPYEPVRQLTIPARIFTPAAQMLLEISVEPEGGSTTGRPTGPVIFIGRLAVVGAER